MPTDRKSGALHHFVSALRALVSQCERSAEILHQAAETMSDPTLKPMLDVYAMRRDVMVARLSTTLAELGATPTVAHRWGGIARPGDGDRAILGACERSETQTLERIQRVFALDLPDLPGLPDRVQGVLARGFQEIATVCAMLRSWMRPRQLRTASA